MVKYNEIKSNPALARLLAQIQGNRDPVSRWEDNKEFLAILEELGESTAREWAIALLEHTHERCWLLSGRVMHYDALAFDLMRLGSEMKWWVDAQVEIRTPSEKPKRFVPIEGPEPDRLYPKQQRLMEEHNSAEHKRLRGLAESRARTAMAELTPEQERAWLFGRFFPYPGPYAGYSIEISAFFDVFAAWRDEKCVLALELFVANLTPEKMGSYGLDREWVLPPPALWTNKMRRAFERGMLVALTDEHEEPRVSYASLLRARFKQAVENGEMSEPDEGKVG